MGSSASLFANRRRNRIVAAVREDNELLRARIQSLSEETSRLKAELREMADTRYLNIQAPVQKVQVEADLPQCPLPNRCVKVHVTEQKLRFRTDLPQCSLPKQTASANSRQRNLDGALGDIHYCDPDGKCVAIDQNGYVKTFHF